MDQLELLSHTFYDLSNSLFSPIFSACFSRGLMLCPTSIYLGRNECIGEEMLCDGSADCPRGEDEDAELCYFFRLVKYSWTSVLRSNYLKA